MKLTPGLKARRHCLVLTQSHLFKVSSFHHNVAYSFQFGEDYGTMIPGDYGTLVQNSGTGSDAGTMIQHATLVPEKTLTDLESNLGTMVINDDDDDEADDETMKRKFLYH